MSLLFSLKSSNQGSGLLQDVQSHFMQPVSLHVLDLINQYVVKTSDRFLLGYDQGATDSWYHGSDIINAATAGCQW